MSSRISADDISQWFGDVKRRSLPEGAAAYADVKITLCAGEVSLEYIAAREELKIVNVDHENEGTLRDCLRQANVIPVGMQLHTGTSEAKSEKHFKVETLAKWLSDILSSRHATSAYLIPDTNFLIRRYGSNLLVDLIKRFEQFHLRIPRLAILEIESHPRKEREGGENAKLAKRKSFSAFAEVIRLRENGAELLPQIDPRVMQSFSKIAGSGYADAWIRREVHDFREMLSRTTTLQHKQETLFLTSDLLNALSAIAEGIDTGYLWEPSPQDRSYEVNHEKLGKFIVALSVLFERTSMQIQSSKIDELYEFAGVWPSKTIKDWQDDLVERTRMS